MYITQDFITQLAVNSSSLTNGKNLVKKGKFKSLNISEDKTVIFGVCKSSKKVSYNCSLDLKEKYNPIPKCSCNSKQVPCKHIIGLLFCYISGKAFFKSQLPNSIVSKNETFVNKEIKKVDLKPKKITKAKINSSIKKCRLQLEGIKLSEKMLNNIVLSGINGIDKKSEIFYRKQIKELGNYYISGIQASFLELIFLCLEAQNKREFSHCINKVTYINTLLKKSKEYINSKINDYRCYPEIKETFKELMIKTSIEEQIGYTWRPSELKSYNLYKENVELVQIACNRYEDKVNRKYIYEGIWIILSTGEIYKTYDYKPITAREFVKKEDSFFTVLNVSELYIYPGELNSRIRWKTYNHRNIETKDLENLKKYSNKDFSLLIKKVKSQIKNPLLNEKPIYSLKVSGIMKDSEGNLAIFDENSVGIPLKLEKFGHILNKISKEEIKNQVLICSFSYDIENNILYGTPIAIINNKNIIRFYY